MAEAKKVKKPNKFGVVLAAGVGVVLAGYLGLCTWVNGSGMMPNLTLGGLDVSGMSLEQAQQNLTQAIEEQGEKASVTLTYGDWSGTITGDQMQVFGEDSGLNAWNVGRSSFLTQGAKYIGRLLSGNDLDVALSLGYDAVEQQALDQLLDQAEQALCGDVTSAEFHIEGDKLVMTKGKKGLAIDREAVKTQVYQAFEQKLLPDAFAGEQANQVIELVLTETPPTTPDFEAIHTELHVEPKDAEYNPATASVTPHVTGIDFSAADLLAAYEKAAEGETFSIPLTLTEPKETSSSLKSKLFSDLLGQAVTKVGGSANRKFNVKLSAQACNNVVLMPGQVFSYNNTTGSRSASKGYLPAPVYSGGASVEEVGGGICQTSSTIYYAVLHTTLEIVERRAHMYATGYVPDGMDATVYYGSLDFKFRNNTDYPIKVVTKSYNSNGARYLKVQIYGTNVSGRYAVPQRTQFDWVEPTTKYVADESVPRGTTKVDQVQNPYTGRSAQTFRYIYEKNGTLVQKQNLGVSTYKMRPKTVYYNPLDGDPSTWVNGVPPKPEVEKPVVKPETPEVPETPETPETPVVPDTPEAPETPVVPETPETGDGSGGDTSAAPA